MERGKLKIFFGYSAGVGKTYAMLKSAQEAKAGGEDVIIGYIEPHDRPGYAQNGRRGCPRSLLKILIIRELL